METIATASNSVDRTERYQPDTTPMRCCPLVMAKAARVTVMRNSASAEPPRKAVTAILAIARL